MCDPGTLLIASTAVAAIGQGVGALQANAAAKHQAAVAEQNAALSREQEFLSRENTRTAALRHYREVAQVRGQQTANFAANGLDVGFGSAASIARDTNVIAREDAAEIYRAGEDEARGFDVQVANNLSQAQSARQQGRNAVIGGAFGVASTALGGAQQFATLKLKREPSRLAKRKKTARLKSKGRGF